ncbi:MAG: LamG domain-containing protein [Planctomycetes bacterium]|nr:LamG domain-containing protein [Planctomycetota bacterium]
MNMTGTFVVNLEPLGPFKFECKPYVLALSPVKIPEADRKLVAWWKFDETEGGIATDSSGNNIIGTLNGNPQWQPSGGKVGGALAFDGDGDFIDCGHVEGLNITGAVTIAAWIKLSKSTDDQKIAGNQDDISGGYKLSIFSDKAELEVRDSGNALRNNRFVDGGTILQPGVWYHIVGTYSQGGSIKTYVNAKLDREQGTTNILAASSGPLKIGCEPFSGICLFNGLMDEISIYNYALSEADVAEIYSGKSPPTVAQIATLAAGEKPAGWGRNFVPVLIIMIIAVVAAGLATRRKKAT